MRLLIGIGLLLAVAPASPVVAAPVPEASAPARIGVTGVPDPAHCLIPQHINLVGTKSGIADPAGTFFVNVKDSQGLTIPAAFVQIAFGCDDIVLSSVQPYPGVSVSCAPSPVVSAVTDAVGTAAFVISGSAAHRTTASPPGCAQIFANGIPLGSCSVSAFDLDGLDGVNANDIALWMCDRDAPTFRPRADHDGDSIVDPDDLSLLLDVIQQGGSVTTGPRCDGQPASTMIQPNSGGISLRWKDCGLMGNKFSSFACDVEGGMEVLVASVTPPSGVDLAITGFEARLRVLGDQGFPLPDWWRFDPLGCRTAGSLALDSDATGSSCKPIWTVASQPLAGVWMNYGGSIPADQAEIVVVAGHSQPQVLHGGDEYFLFKLLIPHTQIAGVGSCSGCMAKAAIELESVLLIVGGGCAEPAIASTVEKATPVGMPLRSASALAIGPHQLLSTPAWTGSNLVVFQGPPSGVPVEVDEPRARDLALGLSASPNPASGPTTLRFTLPRESRVTLSIHDVSGRRVRSFPAVRRGAGAHTIQWDGLDDQARLVAPGTYFARLRVDGSETVTRVVLLGRR